MVSRLWFGMRATRSRHGFCLVWRCLEFLAPQSAVVGGHDRRLGLACRTAREYGRSWSETKSRVLKPRGRSATSMLRFSIFWFFIEKFRLHICVEIYPQPSTTFPKCWGNFPKRCGIFPQHRGSYLEHVGLMASAEIDSNRLWQTQLISKSHWEHSNTRFSVVWKISTTFPKCCGDFHNTWGTLWNGVESFPHGSGVEKFQ